MDDHIAKPIDAYEMASVLLRWVPPVEPARAVSPKPDALWPEPAARPFDLHGLDLAGAVERVNGDWSALRRILLSFRRDFAGALETLDGHLGAGALQDAVRLVHTVKGLAANIGAAELHRLAELFERDLASGHDTAGRARFEAALQAALRMIDTLPAAEPPTRETPLDAARARTMLRRLAEILEASAIAPRALLEETRVQLAGHLEAARIDGLMAEVDRLDYAAARQSLKEMQEVLPGAASTPAI
jgi:HPt (histidine-containing phosphotransfer) domain-containing protein